MKKRIILPAIFLTGALAVGALGFSTAAAQDSTSYPPIIQKLAERFNLNPIEVQDVFQEVGEEHRAEKEAMYITRLDDMVVDGKLTQEQKTKLLDKHEEMRAKMDELKDLSPEERRTKMQEIHVDMKKWAEENGIEMPFFTFKVGFDEEHKDKFWIEKP